MRIWIRLTLELRSYFTERFVLKQHLWSWVFQQRSHCYFIGL